MRRYQLLLLAVALVGLPLLALGYFWLDANRKLRDAAIDAVSNQIWPVVSSGDYNEFVATAWGDLQAETTPEEYGLLTEGLDSISPPDAIELRSVVVERRGAEAWHVAELSVDSEPAEFELVIVREATRPDVWRIQEISRTDR